MSRYAPNDDDDVDYRRSRHNRDYSPEYHSGGGGGSTARGFDQDIQQQQQQQQVPQVLQVPQPPPPPQQQQQPSHGLNESYYRESASLLGVPSPSPLPRDSRPRSVPPPSSAVVRRQRSPSRSSSRSSSRSYRGRGFDDDRKSRNSRSRSRAGSRGSATDTLSRARGVVQDNFSYTPAAIGAGLLGAVIGGLVANKASEAALKHRHKTGGGGGRGRRYSDETTPRMVSTILGAVAGGLGANAVANKVEDSRDRGRNRELSWEGRHGREEDLPHYDSGRSGDLDHRNGRGQLYLDDGDYRYDDDRRSSHSRRDRRDRDSDDKYRY